MSRTGFSRADVDTALLADRKVVALARRYRDEAATSTALVLYIGALLASWAENRPVKAADSAPAWMVADPEPYVRELRAVGLLDSAGRIPKRTLDLWMESSRAASVKGREAADSRWKRPSSSNAPALPKQSSSNARAMPVRPSVRPAVPASARARDGAPPRSLKEIIGPLDEILRPKEEKP